MTRMKGTDNKWPFKWKKVELRCRI